MERQVSEKQIRVADIGSALDMTPEEKRVSFFNRYFVFKKHKNVEADKILQVMLSDTSAGIGHTQSVSKRRRKTRRKPKKISKRINIETIVTN